MPTQTDIRKHLTVGELEILQHSLGIDERRKEPYRNYFVAGGDDVATCRALVAKGLMFQGQTSDMTGGCPCFHVTDHGQQVAGVDAK